MKGTTVAAQHRVEEGSLDSRIYHILAAAAEQR
jgi:hypothetical protein